MSEDDRGPGNTLSTDMSVQVEGACVAYSYCGMRAFCGEHLVVTCLRVAAGDTLSGHKPS